MDEIKVKKEDVLNARAYIDRGGTVNGDLFWQYLFPEAFEEERKKNETCTKCGGLGRIPNHPHVESHTCDRCGGGGKVFVEEKKESELWRILLKLLNEPSYWCKHAKQDIVILAKSTVDKVAHDRGWMQSENERVKEKLEEM